MRLPPSGAARKIPVAIHIYPFKLEHPDHATHGLFYYADYGEFDPMELLDMRSHGVDGLVTGMTPALTGHEAEAKSIASIRKGYSFLKEMGFRSPLICNTGNLGSLLKICAGK